jgi:hypothetical protein
MVPVRCYPVPAFLFVFASALSLAADPPIPYWEGLGVGESPYIYGIHDPGGEDLMVEAGTPGWITFAIEVGHNPNDTGGYNFTGLSNRGIGVICRFQNAWGKNGGAIPLEKHYDGFAKRCANFVANSPGCRIWLVGNETNLPNEHPGYEGTVEPVSPEMYARCYLKVREEIKKVPGHENDEVIVQALSCWAPPLWPGAPPSFLAYLDRIIAAIGNKTDGFAIHAYTHGPDPAGVLSKEKRAGMYWNFKTYIDVMEHIPPQLRKTSVYITESASCDPHVWTDADSGFVENTYKEIAEWNAWNAQPRDNAGPKARPWTGQKVKCVCLYRWQPNDQHFWGGKPGPVQDFKDAMKHGFYWTKQKPKKYVPPPPPPETPAAAAPAPPPPPAVAESPKAPPPPPKPPEPGDESRRLLRLGENYFRGGIFDKAQDCLQKVVETGAEGDAEMLQKAKSLLLKVEEKLKR